MPFTPISWPVESTLQLCRVPWDGNYRDCVRFPSEAARTAYFAGLISESVKLDKMTFLKPGEPIMVNVPYSRAYTMNYCVVKNPELPVPGEVTPPTLYYFVTSVAYVAPNTTALTVELDVWQTYIFGVHFGRCFLEQGHWAIQKCGKMRDSSAYGSKILDAAKLREYATIAESLDIGNEYLIAYQQMHPIYREDAESVDSPWFIILAATTDLSANWGTMDAPSIKAAFPTDSDGLPGAIAYWAVDGNQASAVFQQLQNAPWVSKGILSVTLFPKDAITRLPSTPSSIGTIPAYRLTSIATDNGASLFYEDIHDIINEQLPERYRGLLKFHTFPYSVVELSNHEGTPTLLKPELCVGSRQWFRRLVAFPQPFTRIMVYPAIYGLSVDAETETVHEFRRPNNTPSYLTGYIGAGLDNAVYFNDFPQFSLTNDGYLNYMASTRNTRAYQYEAAGWSQSKASAYYNNTLTNELASLDTAQENKNIQNVQDAANMAIGAVGAIADMNYGGAVAGLVGGGVNLVGGNLQFMNNQELQRGIANNNALTAEFAARGDYQIAISGINAAVQDAALTPPSVVGQMGGNGFNAKNGLFNVEFRVKMPDAAHIVAVGEYWLRYGYACRRFMQPPQNLQCMDHATYWKTKECYLDSAQADEGAKQVIRGIMEKGVTVYNDPSDIGRLDFADNKPL